MIVPEIPPADTAGDEKRRTSGGVEVTDELVERLAGQAERGYDPGDLRVRTVDPQEFRDEHLLPNVSRRRAEEIERFLGPRD